MQTERKYWLDDPRHVKWIVWTLYGICILLLLLDPLYHKHDHSDFDWERIFGFHAGFGFVVFAVLVLAGKQLRRLLKRDEDYYDR